jgi:hypothetical protein
MRGSLSDLGATAALAALTCGAVVGGAPAGVTIPLGVALFPVPGYLLGQLLLSARSAGLERLAVVAALTLAVPILGGLLLYAAGLSLDRAGWLGLLSGVTLITDLILLLRRRGRRRATRTRQPMHWALPARDVAIFAAALVIGACGIWLARAAVAMQPAPSFTQLWLSARSGHARTASLGVCNQQGVTTRYRLVLLRDDKVHGAWSFTLSNGKRWRHAVPFTHRYGMTANLYRFPDLTRPYRHVATASWAAGP